MKGPELLHKNSNHRPSNALIKKIKGWKWMDWIDLAAKLELVRLAMELITKFSF